MDANKLKQMAADAHDNAQVIGYDKPMFRIVFLHHLAGQFSMMDEPALADMFSLAALGGVDND